ncbi:hypothetical protein BDV40DRAFT_290722 [Aspergillus tamarii]|uniref:F-box domain-containing protein n=1 Tax=Aspergillus tamarii TaxID=41984 RepID=A0A5N6ULZ7_ASPTM|nr:hypothetical protein BDV40DRAFT_290722 [Aspergillus tamarii]
MASGTAYRCKKPPLDVLQFRLRDNGYNAKPMPLVYQLPVEILHLILLNLDIRSIGTLRQVDTLGRQLTHASHTLCIIDSVKRSSYFHIQWLFAEFFHPWCRACPDFGPFLYITTLTRSCYKYSYLRPEYEFARKDIKSLPVIYNIEPPRYCLADITQAKALGMQTYGSGKEVKRVYKGHLRRREENYQNRVQQWIREQRRGIHAGHSRRRSAPTSLVVDEVASWSMQVTVAFPYWDYRTQYWSQRRGETIWNLRPPSREAYYRAFLEADLPQHFLNCRALNANYDFRDIQDRFN